MLALNLTYNCVRMFLDVNYTDAHGTVDYVPNRFIVAPSVVLLDRSRFLSRTRSLLPRSVDPGVPMCLNARSKYAFFLVICTMVDRFGSADFPIFLMVLKGGHER